MYDSSSTSESVMQVRMASMSQVLLRYTIQSISMRKMHVSCELSKRLQNIESGYGCHSCMIQIDDSLAA